MGAAEASWQKPAVLGLRKAKRFLKGRAGESQRVAPVSVTRGWQVLRHFLPHTKKQVLARHSSEEARVQMVQSLTKQHIQVYYLTDGKLGTASGQAQGPENYTVWAEAGKLQKEAVRNARKHTHCPDPLQRLRLYLI